LSSKRPSDRRPHVRVGVCDRIYPVEDPAAQRAGEGNGTRSVACYKSGKTHAVSQASGRQSARLAVFGIPALSRRSLLLANLVERLLLHFLLLHFFSQVRELHGRSADGLLLILRHQFFLPL
jgi:hypothetical protein